MREVTFSGMALHEDLGFSLHWVAPKRDYQPHIHDYHEMEIILSGTAINSINGNSFPIGPGDVFIVGKGAVHEITQIDGLELYNIGFNSRAIRNIGNDMLALPGFRALFLLDQSTDLGLHRLTLQDTELKRIRQLLEEMCSEYVQTLPGFRTALLSDFSRLTVLLSRCYSCTGEEKESWQMAFAMAKLERDYAENISLAELAASLYMSERHFRRQFEKFYHMTPSAYLMKLRLVAATRMLCSTTRSVTEIALACGFSDCNYFTRQFHRQIGVTPTQYRKNNTQRGEKTFSTR